jgi:hypothetical protein
VSRSVALVAVAVAASFVLVALYLALGGTAYKPSAVADPCAPREWRSPHGTGETLEQIVLSTADGAACKLHVSREDLVLALASGDDLSRFARQHGISQGDAEDAIRDGVLRAVDDAEQAGAIGGGLASGLRTVARHLPIGFVLAVLRGASGLLSG